MLVRHRMSQHPVTISPSDTLASARAKMQAGHFRRLPVEDNGQLVGIVTDRDIGRHGGIEDRTRVNMAMTAPAVTVFPDTPVEEAAGLMLTKQIGGLPVVEAGQLVGMLTVSDVLHAFREVLGATTDGSVRIDLVEEESALTLPVAADCINDLGGTVQGVGTYLEPKGKQDVFYIRFCGIDKNAVRAALQAKGYTILGVHG